MRINHNTHTQFPLVYAAGEHAAITEVDTGGQVQIECPYAYTDYTDTSYRAWMAGYWNTMHRMMGEQSD
jgi:hypothetical protein